MRVIQDSDDDDDSLEINAPPQQQPDASAEGPLPTFASLPPDGTGSTESLKRAIQRTHRAHLQSQPSQNEPQSSVSLPEHASKRRKNSIGFTSCQSPNLVRPEETSPLAYGRKTESGLQNDEPGNLEDTMRVTYTHHDPMTTFPEPSSTIPNATQTQQRVLEGVNAPTMLGFGTETEAPRHLLPPEPSVPWSDLMKFTPVDLVGLSESSVPDVPLSDYASTIPVQQMHEESSRVLSQRIGQESSVCSRASPLSHQTGPNAASIDQRSERSAAIKSSRLSTSVPTTSLSSSHRDQDLEPEQSTVQREIRTVSLFDSDDDLAIDLPKESYKPRPSRSRSLKVDSAESIDYSVRPEKAKQASKRRKTTGAVGVTKRVTTPEKVQQICDMGFTPSTTKRALGRNDYDVTRTIEWLVTNGVGEDELATHNTAQKPTPKATRNDHQVAGMDPDTIQVIMRDLNDYRWDEPAIAVANNAPARAISIDEGPNHPSKFAPREVVETKSPKVQVVISDKRIKTTSMQTLAPATASGKKAKRRKTTLDQPEQESITELNYVPAVVLEKKRGRGRPKKASNAVVLAEDLEEEPNDHKPMLQQNEVQQNEVLQDLDLNLASTGTSTHATDTIHDTSLRKPQTTDDTAPIPDSQLKVVIPTLTSQTRESLAKVVGPSPANKGKVPHRVGLSKRARIAPLLRVLKK